MISPGSSRTGLGGLNYIYYLKAFVLLDEVRRFSLSADRMTVVQNGRNSYTRLYSSLDGRNNTFGYKVYYKIELFCLMLRNLVFWKLFVLLLSLSLTVHEIEVNIPHFVPWHLGLFFIRISNGYKLPGTHKYLPMLCRRIANSCDRCALFLNFRKDFLSNCFFCLEKTPLPCWFDFLPLTCCHHFVCLSQTLLFSLELIL